MQNPMVGVGLLVFLAGVLVIVSLFIAFGRYTISDPVRLSDQVGGIFVVDRFTGSARYCGATRGNPTCIAVSERAAAN